MKWRTWLAAPIALALGGCDFAPRYAPPAVATPSNFKDEPAGGGTLPVSGEWWLAFNDRTLNVLQAQVDAANPDLAAAVAANDEAVARANAALSNAYPQVNAVPHFLASKQSANRPLRGANEPNFYGDNLLGVQVAYEIDIWGRVRDIVNSANATAEASADALADESRTRAGSQDQLVCLSVCLSVARAAEVPHTGTGNGRTAGQHAILRGCLPRCHSRARVAGWRPSRCSLAVVASTSVRSPPVRCRSYGPTTPTSRAEPSVGRKTWATPSSDSSSSACLSFLAFMASGKRTRRKISGAKFGTPTKFRSSPSVRVSPIRSIP